MRKGGLKRFCIDISREMVQCVSCANEAQPNARACVTCIEKSTKECVDATTAAMNALDKSVMFCTTQKEYKSNRDAYHRHRLELLYLTNAIPRPNKKTTSKMYHSMSKQWSIAAE